LNPNPPTLFLKNAMTKEIRLNFKDTRNQNLFQIYFIPYDQNNINNRRKNNVCTNVWNSLVKLRNEISIYNLLASHETT
jgi:hypothetical protein